MTSGSPLCTATTGMVTGPTTNTARVGRQSLRLTVKPKAAAMGMVDGAWWPRSMTPLAEFPALLAGVGLRLGWADRVAFNTDGWGEAPRRVVVGDRSVQLEGFWSVEPHLVLLSGPDWHRMTLLVVPPEAGADAAEAALLRAAEPDNTESPAQILISCGVGRSVSGAAARMARSHPRKYAVATGVSATSTARRRAAAGNFRPRQDV